jgi:hypothetical protein
MYVNIATSLKVHLKSGVGVSASVIFSTLSSISFIPTEKKQKIWTQMRIKIRNRFGGLHFVTNFGHSFNLFVLLTENFANKSQFLPYASARHRKKLFFCLFHLGDQILSLRFIKLVKEPPWRLVCAWFRTFGITPSDRDSVKRDVEHIAGQDSNAMIVIKQ